VARVLGEEDITLPIRDVRGSNAQARPTLPGRTLQLWPNPGCVAASGRTTGLLALCISLHLWQGIPAEL
jgi:hypothetical protein